MRDLDKGFKNELSTPTPRMLNFPSSDGIFCPIKSRKSLVYLICLNAEGGIRTPTPLRGPGPQPGASASSATSA